MVFFVIVFLQVVAPVMIEFFQSLDFMNLNLPQERVHHLMELLTFSFGFSTPYRRMTDSDTQPCQRVFQLFCNILGTVVEIGSVKFSGLKNDLPEGVFNDGFLLVIVKL